MSPIKPHNPPVEPKPIKTAQLPDEVLQDGVDSTETESQPSPTVTSPGGKGTGPVGEV